MLSSGPGSGLAQEVNQEDGVGDGQRTGRHAKLPDVEYQLTAELTPPEDAPDLDPLQQVGVLSLLDNRLSNLISVEGPDGVEIVPIEHSLNAHLGGAIVYWLLDAPALVHAENATRAVLEQILDEIELLQGWEVKHCAVTATDDQLESALTTVPDTIAGLVDTSSVEHDHSDLVERKERLLIVAEHLHALNLDSLGEDITADEARYVAGALLRGIELVTVELFDDIQLLEDEGTTADQIDTLWVLDELPPQYADRYGTLFARQLLITAGILGHRITQPEWTPPLCIAEALVLHIAKFRAQTALDLAEVLTPDRVAQIIAALDGQLFANPDHELIYDPDFAERPGLEFENWFHPRSDLGVSMLHPLLGPRSHRDER